MTSSFVMLLPFLIFGGLGTTMWWFFHGQDWWRNRRLSVQVVRFDDKRDGPIGAYDGKNTLLYVTDSQQFRWYDVHARRELSFEQRECLHNMRMVFLLTRHMRRDG